MHLQKPTEQINVQKKKKKSQRHKQPNSSIVGCINKMSPEAGKKPKTTKNPRHFNSKSVY